METGRVGEILGGWQLDRLIGSGGMGDVYLAHRTDGVVRQNTAVKVLRSVYRRGSADEADTLRPLRHPHIARCFDDGLTADGHRYLVMDYIDGRPITSYADQNGLSVHERLQLFLDVCAAIEYAHHHLIVHMDLKPGNILVDAEGTVKIIDFGIARRLEDGRQAEDSGAFSGPYASPEQVQPGSKLGYPADIYSLGAVLYELLCGHEPFSPRLSAAELERQILEETPPPPSQAVNQPKLKTLDSGRYLRLEPEAIARMRGGHRLSEVRKLISGDLDRICLFALRKEADRRYVSVDDLRSDIQKVLEGRTPAIARSGSPVYTVLRGARRRPLLPLALIVAISTTAAGAIIPGIFSSGRLASVENKRLFDSATQAGIKQLREQLRPKLAADPRLAGSLRVLDGALQTAAPQNSHRSAWQEFHDEVFLQPAPSK